MKIKILSFLITFLFLSISGIAQTKNMFTGSQADRDSLVRTSILIRAAFSGGDVDGIMKFHHPEVIKALDYKNYQNGAGAVKAGISETLKSYRLDFVRSDTESLFINDNTAVEQTLFTIQGTPKNGGLPFTFKGRSMIVYVRYSGSPTGWATIREQIQPAMD